jgi:RNA polymerase-binding transcription factor
MRAEDPRKTRKLEGSEIVRFKRILDIQLQEMMRSLDRLGDESQSADSDFPKDKGDFCTTTVLKEDRFRQRGERRLMVRVIEAALARIRQGTFGVCEGCGDDINPRRLDALPWTQYCLRCQEGFKRRGELENGSGFANRHVPLRRAG